MATVMHTVKVLALRLDKLRLDVVINFMKCFPCMEKLYIKVAIPFVCYSVSNFSILSYDCIFVVLKIGLIICIFYLSLQDIFMG